MPQGAVSNGKHIDAFIPPHLKDMFYRHPTRPYAWNNGLDPYGFSTDGLLLYLPLWALNNGGTNSIHSVYAYKHTCAITGALWRPNGRIFDGADDKVSVTDTPALEVTTALTIMIWAYPTAVAKFSAGKRVQGSDDAWDLNTNMTFDIWISNVVKQVTGNTALSQNAWNFGAAVYNNTDIRTYLVGVLDCTPVAATGSIDDTVDNITVGWNYNDATAFTGIIGEFWMYNRALSAGEILAVYKTTAWRYQ